MTNNATVSTQARVWTLTMIDSTLWSPPLVESVVALDLDEGLAAIQARAKRVYAQDRGNARCQAFTCDWTQMRERLVAVGTTYDATDPEAFYIVAQNHTLTLRVALASEASGLRVNT